MDYQQIVGGSLGLVLWTLSIWLFITIEPRRYKKIARLTVTLMSFCLALTIGCGEKPIDYPDVATIEHDTDTESIIIETYPMDRWGYKPAVHSEQGILIKTVGDTLPLIEIGGVHVSQSIWQSDAELTPVIWSIRDCPPCSRLYETADTGYVMLLGATWDDVEILQHQYPALIFVPDATWVYGKPWESDYWPGTVRGFPTTQWVASENMEIAYEVVGYGNQPLWSANAAKKQKIWRGEMR